MSVIFKNKGEIPIAAITTFGVSVKDGSAIGFFGTGLKNSISIILRNGGSITIYSGVDEYKFSTKSEEIRGKEFEIVHMNDKPLGFTTQNARSWDMWMAVREILCNCTDEGGTYEDVDPSEVPEPKEGETLIVVEDEDFSAEYEDRHSFILDMGDIKPLWANDFVEVYPKSTNCLFYKGVRLHEHNHPFCFTYNILKDVKLSEDRLIAYEWSVCFDLAGNLARCTNEAVANTIMTCGEEYGEYHFTWSGRSYSDIFKECAKKYLTNASCKLPDDMMVAINGSLVDNLHTIEGIALSSTQQIKLDRAVNLLTLAKLYKPEYEVKVAPDLGDGVLGLADRKYDTIYLAEGVFNLGTKEVASTLYEEYIHIKYGVDDYTRGFQDHVISALLNVTEELLGEVF